MTDLIDPSSISIPEVDPEALETAASDIRKQGGKIAQTGQDIKGSWAGLESCYTAPEDDTLLSVVDPVAEKGDEVDGDLGEVATALETFAETARDLKAKLEVAKQDAQNFVDSVEGDDSWDDGDILGRPSDKVAEHNALLDRVATWTHQYQEAERECANKITGLFKGGTTFIGADPQGGTEPGRNQEVYGTSEALTDGPTPWGNPQGSDHYFWTDWGYAGADVTLGAVEDAGGMVGAHGDQGWFTGGWGDNAASYWTDAAAGTGALIGVWNPQAGTWTRDGRRLGVAAEAWKSTAHGIFPWTELGERPGYAFGTLYTNASHVAGGVALSMTGVGAVAGVPMTLSRVAKILGGAGRGGGSFDSGGGPHVHADADADAGGSRQHGDGRVPGLNSDGSGGSPEPSPEIGPDGDLGLSRIGDMNESLEGLENAQRPSSPRWTPQPDPAPDYGSDPASERPDAPEPEPEPERPAEPDAQEGDRPSSSAPEQQEPPEAQRPAGAEQPTEQQDPSRLDPTTEEVDDEFAQVARRNEDLGDDMDAVDDGRMAELDGDDPWSIEALENAEGDGARGGPESPDEGSRVPVTPDGMELRHHEPGEGGDGPEGDATPAEVEVADGNPSEDAGLHSRPRLGGSEGTRPDPVPEGAGDDISIRGHDNAPEPLDDPPLEDTLMPRGDERFMGEDYQGRPIKGIRTFVDAEGYFYDDKGNVYAEPPDSRKALIDYHEIQEWEGDTEAIAQNTGYPRDLLDRVKQHLFYREHVIATDPNSHKVAKFSPLIDIGRQWKAAANGTLDSDPKDAEAFRRLLMHEGTESAYMEHGYRYRSTHPDYYDNIGRPNASPRHFGAHDLALADHGPNIFASMDDIGLSRPGFEVREDLSNLDEVVDHVLRELDR
ncbi:hypothetical protein [Streptomonospora wellingtoniae]|uniref:WXG100 family type VII secretion target n=1 Tax=Streptomonospora wellingtoniae TaxID=3075544 RepID=A0ABU2KY39_9ACTN|nr:hypothetical protein [Streptomonospora sp. DSM 45055]MDT0304210.1 hypothetical protein [Streptomonospora sp. DSM 45055]